MSSETEVVDRQRPRCRWVTTRAGLLGMVAAIGCIVLGPVAEPIAHASATVAALLGPAGSGKFGESVAVLSNGNIVVTDPYFNNGAVTHVGAVYLYDGRSHQLISTLTGTTAGDQIGANGITEVGGSNFVVGSWQWINGASQSAGASTWIDGTTGLNGHVSAANSLVGTHPFDQVGVGGAVVLTNGNYVVSTASWNTNAGAATWGNGLTGRTGAIGVTNSLIGSTNGDYVGTSVVALTNGNYVVRSPSAFGFGAVTWGDGAVGSTGLVGAFNSLLGSHAGDDVGTTVTPLTNGNYVVGSPSWDSPTRTDAGAATWRPGNSASPTVVDWSNSLYGSTNSDRVAFGVTALTNGNYVVASPYFDALIGTDGGAATWANGTTGTIGPVTVSNSLISLQIGAQVGTQVVALSNGNYVVSSPLWDNGASADAGAATLLPGTSVSLKTVDATTSLVGSSPNDKVGFSVTALTNGNYTVQTPFWDNGTVLDVGANTWGSGTAGVTGPVSASNSLIGTTAFDQVGTSLRSLTNGNYVVGSSFWHYGVIVGGAATWRPGDTSAAGVVTSVNSLVGTHPGDRVGDGQAFGLTALPNGDYTISSPVWDNNEVVDAGFISRRSGTVASSGPVSSATGLYGPGVRDEVGFQTIVMDDDSVVTYTRSLNKGPGMNGGPGFVTVLPEAGLTGPLSTANSYIGDGPNGGESMVVAPRFSVGRTLVIGVPTFNKVVLYNAGDYVSLDPARLADTRPGFNTVDGQFAGQGALAAGATMQLTVAGRGGVSNDSVAASLNVTAVDPVASGFVTVYPCGFPQPLASNLNFAPGQTVPNAVLATIGNAGKVCIFTSQPTHLVVDVNGSFPPTSTYHSSSPARVLETRVGLTTVDGLQQGTGPAGAGSITEVQINGRAGVPADATAAAINVTVTNPVGAGFVTVYPCGAPRPTASSLNYTPGATVANLVITSVGMTGRVCLFTQERTDLIVDVSGSFPAITPFTAVNPARLLETRANLSTIDGLFNGAGLRSAGTITQLTVTGRGGVPNGATTVVLNVTVTDARGTGYVTVYPCGITPPLASNLNFVTGQTVANAVITKVGTSGTVCILNSQPTHLVVDVTGHTAA